MARIPAGAWRQWGLGMSSVFYAARQPIFDRDKRVYAYELLFRDGDANQFPEVDPNEATSRIIEGSVLNLGLDVLAEQRPAFINFTLHTLLKQFPSVAPKEQVVVELLETLQPGQRLLAECQRLHEQGYTLALDDYIHHPGWRAFYPYVDIIKLDFRETSQADIETVALALREFPSVKLLAEKVESHEEFERALVLGFSYFQGYFFAKPEMIRGNSLSPAQLSLVALLYESSRPDMDVARVCELVQRDVALSYKLLRYANSPFFRRRAEISTIRQALLVLGQEELKKILSVLFTAQASESKPEELVRLSMVRARFCENIAGLNGAVEPAVAFLTGMMSLLDAMLDEAMESVLARLPLEPQIPAALVAGEGALAKLLALARAYERGEFDVVRERAVGLALPADAVTPAYREGVAWASQQMQLLGYG